MTFDELHARFNWRSIDGCPGRWVFDDADDGLITSAIESDATATRHHSPHCRDPLVVLPIDGGGLISYARGDGTCIHTLNNESGFARKLAQMGIRMPVQSGSVRPS